MKKKASLLLEKSLDSLILSIEHFNKPWDRGREEAVLILLDRAFELILKASIIHQGGKIREKRAKETIGFERCVRKCLSDNNLKCLNEDDALTIQVINSLRDAAQHYILDISEQQLYMYAQAGITLYKRIIRDVFSQKLQNFMPERVLPISTKPPTDLINVFEMEFDEIKALITPKTRKRIEARAKLRPLAIVESSLMGERSQPSKGELDRIVNKVQEGTNWKDLFPGVAGLRLVTSGEGLNVSIQLTKKKGEAVHLVPEGTPGATMIAVKKVNELGFYSMGLSDLAKKLELSMPRTGAVVKELNLRDDSDMYKEIRIGKTVHKRYSKKALDTILEKLPELDVDDIWDRNRPVAHRKTFGGLSGLPI